MRKQVIQWIVRHITEEGLRSGDRLPSEHKIATFTKAGRSSVREALQWLAGQGIIEAHAGKGYYLRILEREPIHPSLPTVGIEEIRDLTEARLVIECACAAIAARRATPAEIERIDAFLDAMAAKVATASSIYPETIQFHLMIAQAAHNRTLFSMMQVMVVPWLVAYNARLASDVPDRAHQEFAIHRDLWRSEEHTSETPVTVASRMPSSA